jgi:hypothetical protein
MRLTRLLLIALVVLLAGRTAASQEAKPDSGSHPNYLRPWISADQLHHRVVNHNANRLPGNALLAEDTCLTLHTLVVAREDEHSDATQLVEDRTCTPIRQYQIKVAVEPSPQK